MTDHVFLSQMVAASMQRVDRLRDRRNIRDMEKKVAALPLPQIPPLLHSGFDLIAEIKRRSPSTNSPKNYGGSIVERAQRYEKASVIAISVLTESTAFNGSLEDLGAISAAVACPVMRKDFLVHPLQVLESRLAGADGVLLIKRLLDRRLLDSMISMANKCGMFVLIEMGSQDDIRLAMPSLEYAKAINATIYLGVNCRDLSTLIVDRNRHRNLISTIPSDFPVVAESGLATADDVAEVAGFGYRAGLVGSSVMSAADPTSTIVQMISAGRDAAFRKVAS